MGRGKLIIVGSPVVVKFTYENISQGVSQVRVSYVVSRSLHLFLECPTVKKNKPWEWRRRCCNDCRSQSRLKGNTRL